MAGHQLAEQCLKFFNLALKLDDFETAVGGGLLLALRVKDLFGGGSLDGAFSKLLELLGLIRLDHVDGREVHFGY